MSRTKALMVSAGVLLGLVVIVALLRLPSGMPHDTAEVVYPDSRDRTALTMETLRQHLRELQRDRRRLPASIDEVARSASAADGLTRDAWGRQLRLTETEGGYELRSAGPNGRFDDSDDIVDPDSASVERAP